MREAPQGQAETEDAGSDGGDSNQQALRLALGRQSLPHGCSQPRVQPFAFACMRLPPLG
jgi:hypothetical protein